MKHKKIDTQYIIVTVYALNRQCSNISLNKGCTVGGQFHTLKP